MGKGGAGGRGGEEPCTGGGAGGSGEGRGGAVRAEVQVHRVCAPGACRTSIHQEEWNMRVSFVPATLLASFVTAFMSGSLTVDSNTN